MNRPLRPQAPTPVKSHQSVKTFATSLMRVELARIMEHVKENDYKNYYLEIDQSDEDTPTYVTLWRLDCRTAEELAVEKAAYENALCQYERDLALWKREQDEKELAAAKQRVAQLEAQLGKQ